MFTSHESPCIYIKKVKVKWSRYRPGVAQRVVRGITLLFYVRGTRKGWVASSTPRRHLTPGKDPVPILQEVAWAPGPVWTGGKSRLHRDWIPDHPARSQSLYRLSYPAHTHTHTHTHIYAVCHIRDSDRRRLNEIDFTMQDCWRRSSNIAYGIRTIISANEDGLGVLTSICFYICETAKSIWWTSGKNVKRHWNLTYQKTSKSTRKWVCPVTAKTIVRIDFSEHVKRINIHSRSS